MSLRTKRSGSSKSMSAPTSGGFRDPRVYLVSRATCAPGLPRICSEQRRRHDLRASLTYGAPTSRKLEIWRLDVTKRRGSKRAKVALARKIAVILHRLWVDGTTYRWSEAQLMATRGRPESIESDLERPC